LAVSSTDSTPFTVEHSNGADVYIKLVNDAAGAGNFLGASSNNLTFWTENTQRLTIDGAGRLGIGTSSPSQILELKTAEPRVCLNATNAAGEYGIEFETNGTRQGHIFHNHTSGELSLSCGENTAGSHFMTFNTGNGAEMMRITNSGNVIVGGTSTSSTNAAYISQNGEYVSNRTASGSDLWNGKLNGTVTSNIDASGSATFSGDVTAPNINQLFNSLTELRTELDLTKMHLLNSLTELRTELDLMNK
jgi:hypothetical protein